VSIETRSAPALTLAPAHSPLGFPIYVARCPRLHSLAATSQLYVITRTARARASYPSALPSTRAIETRSLPTSLALPIAALPSMSLSPRTPSLNRDVFYLGNPFLDSWLWSLRGR